MTRAGLKGAIEWAKVADVENGAARVYANALALLIEAAEAHLKTMSASVTIYVVTAVDRSIPGEAHPACVWRETREKAEATAAAWREEHFWKGIQITEVEING